MCQLAEEVENKYSFDTRLTLIKDVDTASLYTKEQVEELLQKQRELCVEQAKVKLGRKGINHPLAKQYWIIDEDSILNAILTL